MTAALRLRCRDCQIRLRCVYLESLAKAALQEEVVNHSDSTANIQQGWLWWEWAGLDSREKQPSGGTGAATLEAPEISPRGTSTELLINGLAMTVGHLPLLQSQHLAASQQANRLLQASESSSLALG